MPANFFPLLVEVLPENEKIVTNSNFLAKQKEISICLYNLLFPGFVLSTPENTDDSGNIFLLLVLYVPDDELIK